MQCFVSHFLCFVCIMMTINILSLLLSSLLIKWVQSVLNICRYIYLHVLSSVGIYLLAFFDWFVELKRFFKHSLNENIDLKVFLIPAPKSETPIPALTVCKTDYCVACLLGIISKKLIYIMFNIRTECSQVYKKIKVHTKKYFFKLKKKFIYFRYFKKALFRKGYQNLNKNTLTLKIKKKVHNFKDNNIYIKKRELRRFRSLTNSVRAYHYNSMFQTKLVITRNTFVVCLAVFFSHIRNNGPFL